MFCSLGSLTVSVWCDLVPFAVQSSTIEESRAADAACLCRILHRQEAFGAFVFVVLESRLLDQLSDSPWQRGAKSRSLTMGEAKLKVTLHMQE